MALRDRIYWANLDGARSERRKIYLKRGEFDCYYCPVSYCEQNAFQSKRGCRKHIDAKHTWFYYFDQKPLVAKGTSPVMLNTKIDTKHMPRFPVHEGFGKDLTNWLSSAFGGGFTETQAIQRVTRIMKFLKFCNGDDDDEVSREFVDYCLASPPLVSRFIDYIGNDWKLSSAAQISYLQAIADVIDFRRFEGVAVESFAVTEIYIHRGKRTFTKRKKEAWSKDLGIDNLEAMNCWATIDDLQKVIPFHQPNYTTLLEKCKELTQPNISPSELTFCTRFIAVYLFIKVKGSRPMTYQYLTVEMFEASKTNGGFVDQTKFKTADRYIFDTLLFDEESLNLVDEYTTFIRPLLHPKCDYLLVTRNGTQYSRLGDLMAKLVFEAIGKHIHPTRFRQIVETESAQKLTLMEQDIVNRDQKHSSHVARIHYQKLCSREVATQGKRCFEKLCGDNDVVDEEQINSELPVCPVSLNENDVNSDDLAVSTESVDTEDDEIFITPTPKKMKKREKRIPFTKEEDAFIIKGIKKYGKGHWHSIIEDTSFNFNDKRTATNVQNRALKLFKNKDKYLIV